MRTTSTGRGTGTCRTRVQLLVNLATSLDARRVAVAANLCGRRRPAGGGRPYTLGMTEQQAELIVADPDVVHGQARIRGTRIPVSVVLDCLAAGLSEVEILRQYPSLTVEGIRAAAAYGAALAREEIHPLPA